MIRVAFPDLEPVFGSHGDYGGHRAPRDHTISFRLRDERGKFRSNVVWLMPEWLSIILSLGTKYLIKVTVLSDEINGADYRDVIKIVESIRIKKE